MGTAKVVSLDVWPVQSSLLCFETGGILEELSTELGASVNPLNFSAFYKELRASPTTAGDPSQLLYDSSEIRAKVSASVLGSVRSEPGKGALDTAIKVRQNSYFSKYANIPALVARMNEFHSPATPGSKPNRLTTLRSLAANQASGLRAAYSTDGRIGVVKETISDLSASLSGNGNSTVTGTSKTTVTGSSSQTEDGRSTQNVTGTSSGSQSQRIVNTDYGYRMPLLESQAQHERAQISLMDEQFAEFMLGQSLPNQLQVYANELKAIDNEVLRLQIAYLNSILLSPIPGRVTGVYKSLGDAVQAAEPVIRVENSESVLLMAALVYRDRISIGAPVQIETTLFDKAGPTTSVTGNVVSASGGGNDNRWEVVIKCGNLDAAQNEILPLRYRFDYDNTTVVLP